VAIDTSFAMAYRKLGVALNNAAMPRERADSALAHAYRYRDHLPDRERILTTASYFHFGPGRDRQKAAAAYREELARDSLDPVAMGNLAILYETLRQFPRAESLSRIMPVAEGGLSATSLQTFQLAQIANGELAGAESTAVLIRANFPNSPATNTDIPVLYAMGRIDSATVRNLQIRASGRDAAGRSLATRRLSRLAIVHGRLTEGARYSADARAQDLARGAPDPPLSTEIEAARTDIWFRDQAVRGGQEMDAALARTPLRTIPDPERLYFDVATVYALAGRPDRAHAVLAQYTADTHDSALMRDNEPQRHDALAEIALAERRPMDAVAEFRLGDVLPDGPVDDCTQCLPGELGRAYDAASMPDSAIANYERYLATPSASRLRTDTDLLAGIHKRLGELYEAKGERGKAAGHYVTFVELWKNADPELQPKVAEVRQRLARLQDVEKR
jgi:eukaryotic-like serine/threonine-protein kinase